MRASVVVQDHVMWLPGGGPQLRVLLVSGAVRQCRAPDLAGQTADDVGETSGRRGEAEGEATTGARKGSGRQDKSRRDAGREEDGDRHDESRGDKGRGDNGTRRKVNEANRYRGVRKEEGRSGRDG